MRQILVQTQVDADLETVKAGFTRELFLQLRPPFAQLRLLRFDGCKKGDRVHLKLGVAGLLWLHWSSNITDDGETADAWYFIDEGDRLPFFLRSWRHIHRVEATSSGSVIIDDIQYQGVWWIPAPILALILRKSFEGRRAIYRRVFAAKH